MELKKNYIPDRIRKIHFIAICGTGMGALAGMLQETGYEITGSDQNIYPPMSDFLSHKGIEIFNGFNEKNISDRVDLIVVGNAVRRDNPEVVAMLEMGLPFCSMPQAIKRFIAWNKKPIIITGTHGKTTISSILAWICYTADSDPSFFVGGILKNFNSSYRMGNGKYIIVEGDEYDTAFFDKGPKFLHYVPHMAAVTSVEYDHADIFSDIDHVKQAFDRFISGMSPRSSLFAFDGDENLADLLSGRDCRIFKYGREKDSPWKLGEVSIEPPWNYFEILKHGETYGTFKTKLMGIHNLLNTMVSIAIADHMQISHETISRALETFQGVKRRQEVRGQKRNITVMDDFAHHPTAVRETSRAVKPFYPNGRLVAVFEPRTNTSMRNVFQDVYPVSFDGADLVCVRKPPLLHKIAPGERFSSEKLVEDLQRLGKKAFYFPDTDAIIDFLIQEAKPGDLILIMSNGGFDNIHERLLEAL